MIAPVPNVDGLDPAVFRTSYLDRGQPVLIPGLAANWPAKSKWTTAQLRDEYGDVEVPIRDYLPDSEPGHYVKRHMPLREFLNYWEALPQEGPSQDKNLYLAEWNFSQQCPSLLEDFDTPPHFQDDWIDKLPRNLQFGRLWIFIGHPRVETSVHVDTFCTSAWLTMIQGSKLVRMVSPDSGFTMKKGADLFSAEAERTCKERGITLHEAKICEGETLFIPGRWYHQVRNVSKNIMVTKNFADAANLLYFLAAFEERMMVPLHALHELRNGFLQERMAPPDSTTANGAIPELAHAFVEEQRSLVANRVLALRAYADTLVCFNHHSQ